MVPKTWLTAPVGEVTFHRREESIGAATHEAVAITVNAYLVNFCSMYVSMMRFGIAKLPLLVVLTCTALSASAQMDTVLVKQYVGRAMDYMDRNLTDDAIKQWDLAILQRPDFTPYKYERALCFVMAKRYDEAITALLPIYQDTMLYDRGYQLLGNAYDYTGDSTESRTIYEAGLKAYPNSGRLHYELGAAAFLRGDESTALDYWVRGTRVEPRFGTNYYWICKGFARSANRIWALFYGELFINLEPDSDRTFEISELLYKAWNAGLRLGSEDPIRFCSDELLSQPSSKGADQMNFATAFEYTMALASQKFIPDTGVVDRLSISQIVEARVNFLKAWVKAGYLEQYPNDLFDWQARVMKEGYLSEYLTWIISSGDKMEMRQYYDMNGKRYDLFFGWLTGLGGYSFATAKCVGYGCTDS